MTLYGLKTKFGQIDMLRCLCCRCAVNVLQFCCKFLVYLFLNYSIIFSIFCFASMQNFIVPKQKILLGTSDFIAHHWQNVLNSRKYQKFRYLTYFHDSAPMGHGVHKYFRVFFGFKIVLNGFENIIQKQLKCMTTHA